MGRTPVPTREEMERAKARIRELEAENAALKESALAKANDIISRRNAQLREALGAADKTLVQGKAAIENVIPLMGLQGLNIEPLVGFTVDVNEARALIDAALKRDA